MMRQHKSTMILTSIVILLPILAGVLLWGQLPAEMPIHWNSAGEVDGQAGKLFVVFLLPLGLLALHWVCFALFAADPKRASLSSKPVVLSLWLVPVISVVCNFLVYSSALGSELDTIRAIGLLCGLIFVGIGNYLPKCPRNYTIGYKIPWTLDSDENWFKTHRLGGKCMVIGGLLMLLSAVLGGFWLAFAAAMVLSLVPIPYSFMLFRKAQQ